MPKDSVTDALSAKAGPLLRDWTTLTWFRDTEKLGPLPRYACNWILLTAWVGLAYLLTTTYPFQLYLGGFAVLTFLYTLGRSHRVMNARRTLVARTVDSTRQQAGHPRPTTTNPVDPNSLVTIRRWGRKSLPLRIDVAFTADSPAGQSPLSRGQLEALIDKIPNPHTGGGGGWAYSIVAKTGRLRADAVPATDPRLHQQREITYLRNKFREWFKILDKHLKTYTYDLDITDWSTQEHPQKGPVPVPKQIVFVYDGHNASTPDFRDQVERACDSELRRGDLVWVYDWSTSGQLEITGAEPASVPAHRKLAQRWMADLVAGQAPRSKDSVVTTVTGWQEDAHGDPWVPIAFDVEFGSGAFTNGTGQRSFEDAADDALATMYPALVWVFEWTVSATTALGAKAFPADHLAALRKAETKRLRQVVESQFSRRGNDCGITILEWEPCDEEAPVAQPARIKVTFGSLDVSKVDTQDAFEQHFDSMFAVCDWNYSWRPDVGHVLLTAVPPLPLQCTFPANGTQEFDRFLELARQGKILFGPKRRGGEVIWDLAQFPHGLIGGQTGAGKSFALGIPLFAVLYQPDFLEAIVVDPKKMDFTWTVEFPNVVRFGAEDEEIALCIEYAAEQMEYRQQRCGKRGVRNLQELRDLYERHPEFEAEDGPVPKRMLLFFDEIADYLAKSKNKEVEEIKEAATGLLEKLARLARALEINMVTAAQKPGGDIISTQLRSQLGFRMCVGPVDKDTSPQIILDNHGTLFPKEGNPKGRAWVYDSKDGYRMTQVMFLPNDTQPAPWDKSISVHGSKDLVRARLRALGYEQVMVPNKYGGKEPRWVFTDHPTVDSGREIAVERSSLVADVDQSLDDDATTIAVQRPTVVKKLITSPAAAQDDWGDDWD